MEKHTSSETLGCGSSRSSEITLNIQTTTGGNFSITVENNNTVDQLKKIVSKKLKVSKDRICLLHRERQLRDGTLEDNGLMDGSRVILLPSVETGLLTQRPESSVMQALESLNDSQVNDFLSGKSPLNLTMRLGDHMMLIQLQLSTLNPVTTHTAAGGSANIPASSKPRTFNSPQTIPTTKIAPSASSEDEFKRLHKSPLKIPTQDGMSEISEAVESNVQDKTNETPDEKEISERTNVGKKPVSQTQVKKADDLKSFLRKQDIETLQNAFEIFKSLAEMQEDMEKESEDASADDSNNQSLSSCSSKYSYGNDNNVMDSSSSSADLTFEEQSPIESLSNLVSSPLKSSLQSNYSPVTIPLNKEHCTQIEDKPSVSIAPPKYVPLPSSLKNNLIDSLVEGCGNKEIPGQTQVPLPLTSPLITDPIAANLTSCLCSKLNPDYNCATNCHAIGHAIIKVDNPHSVMMDTDPCDEQSPTTADNVSVTYSENKLINGTANDGLSDSSVENVEIPNSVKVSTNHLENPGSSNSETSPSEVSESTKNKRLHYLLHKTSKHSNPITQNKQKAFMQSVVNKHLKKKLHSTNSNSNTNFNDLIQPSTSKQSDFSHSGYLSNHFENLSEPSTSHCAKETSVFRVPNIPSPVKVEKPPLASASVSDTKALIEASKNLTQTLKKLSKEVLTSKVDLTNEENTRAKIGQGAVIESMKHHGKGIYSGTFSGTLNPALQDRFGRPKRDISTIIHILNDLLCATPPQYRRGARITFEPTHNSTNSSARTKQRDVRHQTASCSADHQGASECACSKCSSASGKCPYGECNGHYPTPSPSASENALCSCKSPHSAEDHPQSCGCSSSRLTNNASVTSPIKKCNVCLDKEKDDKLKRNSSKTCKRCHSVSTLALENSKTKCKLDHLRLVMQQKKQKREARKMRSAPYVTTNNSSNVTALQTEAPSVIAEEIETLA